MRECIATKHNFKILLDSFPNVLRLKCCGEVVKLQHMFVSKTRQEERKLEGI